VQRVAGREIYGGGIREIITTSFHTGAATEEEKNEREQTAQ
jgi:hypothetical protein